MTKLPKFLTVEPPSDLPQELARAWQTGVVAGIAVLYVILAGVVNYLIFTGIGLGLWQLCIAIPLVLVLIERFPGWPVLLVLQLRLIALEAGDPEAVRVATSLFPCLLGLGLVVYSLRQAEVRRAVASWFAAKNCQSASRSRWTAPAARTSDDDAATTLVSLGRLLVPALAVVLAFLLLSWLPTTVASRAAWFQFSVANQGVFFPGAALLAFLVAVAVVLRELVWRRLTPAQARLYLRSTLLAAHYGDLRMISRRRWKVLSKRMGTPVRSRNQ